MNGHGQQGAQQRQTYPPIQIDLGGGNNNQQMQPMLIQQQPVAQLQQQQVFGDPKFLGNRPVMPQFQPNPQMNNSNVFKQQQASLNGLAQRPQVSHEVAGAARERKKKKISRLARLLAQPDIFEALLKIGNGTIKSYDDLDMDAMAKQQQKDEEMKNLRRRGDPAEKEKSEELPDDE